jgi:tetrahydromethanopterin S-methyltransferase subunit F
MANDPNTSNVAQAVQEVTERAQLLIREEIALAKAELQEKISKLVKGIAVGAVAGIFMLLALLYFLDTLAWGFWSLVDGEDAGWIWLGFLFVGLLLLVLGAIAGFLAARWIKKGSPPKPQMAIEEAQLIRQTIQSSSSTEVRR